MEVFAHQASSTGRLVDSILSTGNTSRRSTPVTLGTKAIGGPTSLPLLLDMTRRLLLTVSLNRVSYDNPLSYLNEVNLVRTVGTDKLKRRGIDHFVSPSRPEDMGSLEGSAGATA